MYPEFLPDPKIEFRNSLREKLERQDMLAHRSQIDIPEFYVGKYMSLLVIKIVWVIDPFLGTIMAVETSDKHSPGKLHRFLGICTQKIGCGLRANFTLRNVIDGQVIKVSEFCFQ